MRILYLASGIITPGSHGGAVHVLEVAGGLRALGHEVYTVAGRRRGEARRWQQAGSLEIDRLALPKALALLGLARVSGIARRFQPDVIMERFYNLAGAGMIYARRHRLPTVLEINAPPIDPPGTAKDRVDRLCARRLSAWARTQCTWATRIVTPLPAIVPAGVAPAKIVQLPWGANVERFDPRSARSRTAEIEALRARLGIATGVRVVAFLGSFRHWHGALDLVQAGERLAARRPEVVFLLIGDGPERAEIERRLQDSPHAHGFVLPGAVDHAEVPLYLALADIGVAPFRLSAHAPLSSYGFYWSPLKIFEYMAMALPTVTVATPPLNEIIRPGREGWLYPDGDLDALAAALERLLDAPAEASRMGASARERVVERYSWQAHGRALEQVLQEIVPTPCAF